MAKYPTHILELARRGAQHRYDELVAEIDALTKQFPDLRSGAREVVRRGRRAVAAAAADLRSPKRRRKMSAAARKAISDAQKARWARQKATAIATGGSPKRRTSKKR